MGIFGQIRSYVVVLLYYKLYETRSKIRLLALFFEQTNNHYAISRRTYKNDN